MEIITAAFATVVAAFCFLAIVKNDVRDQTSQVADGDATTPE